MNKVIGKRICIIGLSSSGKSTLANIIGEKKSYDVLHIDQISHVPNTNWTPLSREVWTPIHDEFIKKDKWVVDGSYNNSMPQRFARADTVIFIKMNRFACAYRFLKRAFCKSPNRYGKLEGAIDSFNFRMLKYIILEAPSRNKKYEKLLKENPHLKVIYLYSFAEIDEFVKNL